MTLPWDSWPRSVVEETEHRYKLSPWTHSSLRFQDAQEWRYSKNKNLLRFFFWEWKRERARQKKSLSSREDSGQTSGDSDNRASSSGRCRFFVLSKLTLISLHALLIVLKSNDYLDFQLFDFKARSLKKMSCVVVKYMFFITKLYIYLFLFPKDEFVILTTL